MFSINSGNFKETAYWNSISAACGIKFRRIEDANLSIVDLEGETSLYLGPAVPRRRSARLLDLVLRVRIRIPPLKVKPTSSGSQPSAGILPTGSGLGIGRTSDIRRGKRRREILLPYPRAFF